MAPVLFLSVEPMLGPVDLLSVTMPDGDHLSAQLTHVGSGGCINWVIVGCESGSNRRETKLEWVRSLRDQCQAAGVAFFMKQLEVNGNVTDDINQFPADLQIREYPNQTATLDCTSTRQRLNRCTWDNWRRSCQ